MDSYRRLLAPRDYSAASEHALTHAIGLARTFGADLHLLHAEVLHSDPVAEARAAAHKMSAGAVRDLLSEAGVSVEEADVRDVAPAPAIVRYAEEQDVDLIVMGTHGRRGVRRLFLGSVTEEVVRAAHCDVLAVRSESELPGSAPVLVGVDFSRSSKRALRRARQLAARLDAPLHVLHAVHLVPYPSFYGTDVVTHHDLPASFITEAEEALESFASDDDQGDGVDVRIEIRVGQPFRQIADAAAETGAGLVVLGTRGLSGLQHALLGSTTERTLRITECPVLVTKLPTDEPAGP